MIKKSTFLLIQWICCLSLWAQQRKPVENELIISLKPAISINQFLESTSPNQFQVKRKISTELNAYWIVGKYSDETIQAFQRDERVVFVQKNYPLSLRSSVPNDPQFSNQWGMQNLGQNGGKTGADIHLISAWDSLLPKTVTALGDTIVVAVIDTKVDTAQEDISFFHNYADTPNNGIDDDGNGFIDDYIGYNFNLNNSDVQTDLAGYPYHGTHVSGVIGAIANNSKGIVGVAAGVKILPLVADDLSTSAHVISAYDYAVQMKKLYFTSNKKKGAYIVATNTSLGFDYAFPADEPIWCAMYDALGAFGILNSTATANNLVDVDVVGDIPTTCTSDYMIAVTGNNSLDEIMIAGYGKKSIDISAPGYNIFSTKPLNNYGYSNGTSHAAPFVAGATAYLFSQVDSNFLKNYHTNFSAYTLKMRQAILCGVDTLPSFKNKTTSGGRLNLKRSVEFLGKNPICPLPVNAVSEINTTAYTITKTSHEIYIQNLLGERGKISLYTSTGACLNQFYFSESEIQIPTEIYSAGIYIVQIKGEKYTAIKKIQIHDR